jgi:hypothetical protein
MKRRQNQQQGQKWVGHTKNILVLMYHITVPHIASREAISNQGNPRNNRGYSTYAGISITQFSNGCTATEHGNHEGKSR